MTARREDNRQAEGGGVTSDLEARTVRNPKLDTRSADASKRCVSRTMARASVVMCLFLILPEAGLCLNTRIKITCIANYY